MSNELISIIVPVYNAEKYLHKCINSIVEQTYKNLEIILVDDESPDLSGQICDEFKKKDKRIKVIHKKNGGVSDARNVGLEHSTGELIGFVDSDDYIHPNMYRTLYDNLIKTNSDLAECAAEEIYSNKTIDNSTDIINVYSGFEALKSHLKRRGNADMPRPAVWSKIFRRSLIEGVRFPKGEIHEDYLFTFKSLYYAKKVCLVDISLYKHVYTNSSSITQVPFNEKDLIKEKHFLSRMNFLYNTKLFNHYKLAEASYYKLVLQFYYRCSFAKMKEEKRFKDIILSNKKLILKSKLGPKKKAEFISLFFSPKLYLLIRKIIMKLTNKWSFQSKIK